VLQQIAPKYIATGEARLIYYNFPIIGPASESAAQAAECAGDQNKFWTYADYLFAHQDGENSGALSPQNLKKFAVQLGLNSDAFNTCLDSGKYGCAGKSAEGPGRTAGCHRHADIFHQR
jgi:protein-disulfide isomerase